MKHTKVFATTREKKELSKLAKEARDTPMWDLTVSGMMNKPNPWAKVAKRMEEIVRKHGLPLPGNYGMLDDGEFVTE
jgi:hypothetical protein